MLQSLTKLILFLLVVAALTWGASWLLQLGGGVRIVLGATELNLGPLQAVIAVLALLLVLWLLLKVAGLLVAVVRFVNGDETAVSRFFDRSRERRGVAAVTDSLLALANGDGKQALAEANKAGRLLRQPRLTGLLAAQAAEASGDPARSEAAWRHLLGDDTTRFAAIRGLMRDRLQRGETEVALQLARRAFALKPANVEVQDTLLRLQAQGRDWAGARQTLAEKGRLGALPRDVVRRRDAVLALGEMLAHPVDLQNADLRERAIATNRLSPELIPAAVLAADALRTEGRVKPAARVLKKAWDACPHPDLAAAFARIAPDETPEERLRRFQALTGIGADQAEALLLQAELLIAANDFPGARRVLGPLVETDPTSRALALMAAISRGEGEDDAVTRGWLARALVAPRGPQWTCEVCGTPHQEWRPVCDHCGGIDTLSWKRPAQDVATGMPGAAEMLPLIIGPKSKPAAGSADATDAGQSATTTAPSVSSDAPPSSAEAATAATPKDGAAGGEPNGAKPAAPESDDEPRRWSTEAAARDAMAVSGVTRRGEV